MENPEKPAHTPTLEPTTLVIFGITGDLAQRKLLPALYHLSEQNLLPSLFTIIGVTRRGITMKELLERIEKVVTASGKKPSAAALEKLSKHIEIMKLDLLDQAEYSRLRDRLDTIEDEHGTCINRLFYLAIPGQNFESVIDHLGAGRLNESCQHGSGARLLIEKPFGYDLASAQELIHALNKHFKEEQIYRIDHYLAKETAQNILSFRFKNPIFRRMWDGKSITSITITADEKIDIEGRANFYEQTGALRDFIQSHLLQLLALTTMDEPSSFSSDPIHRQKLALLHDIIPIPADAVDTHAVRGQYEGYRDEVENPHSTTETYAAIRLQIDSERWRNVPVVLRTGKALAAKVAEISIVFADAERHQHVNTLTIRIQPDEGISLQLFAKKPGFSDQLEPVEMSFDYDRSFAGDNNQPDAYERVLVDALRGDKTLFATSDEVVASWRVIENVIHEWAKDGEGLYRYKRGSDGPAAGEALMRAAQKPAHHE